MCKVQRGATSFILFYVACWRWDEGLRHARPWALPYTALSPGTFLVFQGLWARCLDCIRGKEEAAAQGRVVIAEERTVARLYFISLDFIFPLRVTQVSGRCTVVHGGYLTLG